MKISFLGATGTVTGSRYLLEIGNRRVLIDCGLFQGFKNLRLKNWDALPAEIERLDAVVFTHAHLDHSGFLPVLKNQGYRGPVYCTHATKDLCGILLPDSGYLQEEEAAFANRHGFSKHHPALPLYTRKDAEASLSLLKGVDWFRPLALGDGVSVEFHPAGHLFGAASVLVREGSHSLAFSGDLGRVSDPLVRAPNFSAGADDLVIESTYGDRLHAAEDPKAVLRDVILRTVERGGVLLVPSFAVGRAQLVLFYIHELMAEKAIPRIPVYLNSPMAAKANEIFSSRAEHESKLTRAQAESVCHTAKIVGTVDESKDLNLQKGPMIILAASGMATGGRVLHHLKTFAPDPKNTILFVGFQAGGTRGDLIVRGANEVKIHGTYWPIRAEVAHIDSMSAHADQQELLAWLSALQKKPRRVFVTHGEPQAADQLRRLIVERFGLNAIVPEFAQSFDLDLV